MDSFIGKLCYAKELEIMKLFLEESTNIKCSMHIVDITKFAV
jgi:hypothetical protein